MFFFKINFSKKIFQEDHQIVKQFGSRSEAPTFFWAWSGSKLFAKIVSRWQKSPLEGKELRIFYTINSQTPWPTDSASITVATKPRLLISLAIWDGSIYAASYFTSAFCAINATNTDFTPGNQKQQNYYTKVLTLVLLNKLRCHSPF